MLHVHRFLDLFPLLLALPPFLDLFGPARLVALNCHGVFGDDEAAEDLIVIDPFAHNLLLLLDFFPAPDHRYLIVLEDALARHLVSAAEIGMRA